MSLIEESLSAFKDILEKHKIFDKTIRIKSEFEFEREGKEMPIEADFFDSKGFAFSNEPCSFEGSLSELLKVNTLNSNGERGCIAAAINAVMKQLGYIRATIPCSDEKAHECAYEMAYRLHLRWGNNINIGLVGYHDYIADSLIKKFSSKNVQISDLDVENIGKNMNGVEILDGKVHTKDVIANNFLALVTGSSVVNGTIDEIIDISGQDNKNRLVIFYGVTIAGINYLGRLKRLCFKAQ